MLDQSQILERFHYNITKDPKINSIHSLPANHNYNCNKENTIKLLSLVRTNVLHQKFQVSTQFVFHTLEFNLKYKRRKKKKESEIFLYIRKITIRNPAKTYIKDDVIKFHIENILHKTLVQPP